MLQDSQPLAINTIDCKSSVTFHFGHMDMDLLHQAGWSLLLSFGREIAGLSIHFALYSLELGEMNQAWGGESHERCTT